MTLSQAHVWSKLCLGLNELQLTVPFNTSSTSIGITAAVIILLLFLFLALFALGVLHDLLPQRLGLVERPGVEDRHHVVVVVVGSVLVLLVHSHSVLKSV